MLIFARECFSESILDGVFMSDVEQGAPADKAEVCAPGCHTLRAQLWLSSGAQQADACLNLLHLLLATEAPSADRLKVRPRQFCGTRALPWSSAPRSACSRHADTAHELRSKRWCRSSHQCCSASS